MYEVERIIGKMARDDGQIYYQVQWKSDVKNPEVAGEAETTWEPEENLENVRAMIEEFNTNLGQ
jgi:Chromo (CHRromatin Organisation MOdifier) domain